MKKQRRPYQATYRPSPPPTHLYFLSAYPMLDFRARSAAMSHIAWPYAVNLNSLQEIGIVTLTACCLSIWISPRSIRRPISVKISSLPRPLTKTLSRQSDHPYIFSRHRTKTYTYLSPGNALSYLSFISLNRSGPSAFSFKLACSAVLRKLSSFFSPNRGWAFRILSRDFASPGEDDPANDVSLLPTMAIRSA